MQNVKVSQEHVNVIRYLNNIKNTVHVHQITITNYIAEEYLKLHIF